jgi:hypothetical protein
MKVTVSKFQHSSHTFKAAKINHFYSFSLKSLKRRAPVHNRGENIKFNLGEIAYDDMKQVQL